MKFRRATHTRDGVYRREFCESVRAESDRIEVDPTHWMETDRGLCFDEICANMQHDDENWPVPPTEREIAHGLVRLLELGLVEMVDE